MDTQEGIICRLCFKVCDSFKAIEGELKDFLDMVLTKIDLTVIQEPMMCTYCAAMLIKCSQFKTTCLHAQDCILPFTNNKDTDLKLNLKEVYRMSKNGIGLSEVQDICGFCMSPVKSCSAISFDVEGGDVVLQNMIEQCLPELNFSVIKKPVICAPCHNTLESCFCFVTNCLIVEEKIKKYREIQDINGKGQIELSGLLEFMTSGVTTKVEKEYENEEEIGNRDDLLEVKQIFFDVSESVKEDLEIKNESCMEMDDHFMPKNMLAYQEDIKIEKTFYGESKFKEENVDVLVQLNEEIDIKTEECDFDRCENDALPQPEEVTTRLRIIQKRLMPNFEEDNKNISTIKVYKCDACSYETKRKNTFQVHLLTHKDPSDVPMYRCDTCLYQTKRKNNFKAHLLTHKDPSEVTMYKCSLCSFQTKLKRSIKQHNVLKHKDPSEVTMYKCNLCSFQTKLKSSLKQHNMLKHKVPSEVTMYKCSFCSFQTKLKKSIERHMLKHKDPSEVIMYKCDSCLYQTKHKSDLKIHLVKHKDPSEVTMYKCDTCLYQTKFKNNLMIHLLKHKDTSEVIMYKCDACLYQTKRKNNLKIHLLKHKDSSEVTMYKCDTCLYQTKRKNNYKVHLLKHKDRSEVTMYPCDFCFFEAKQKSNLKVHLLKHKDL